MGTNIEVRGLRPLFEKRKFEIDVEISEQKANYRSVWRETWNFVVVPAANVFYRSVPHQSSLHHPYEGSRLLLFDWAVPATIRVFYRSPANPPLPYAGGFWEEPEGAGLVALLASQVCKAAEMGRTVRVLRCTPEMDDQEKAYVKKLLLAEGL